MKASFKKRLERLEKEANKENEVDYEIDLSGWTVGELKQLEGWMLAGEVGLPPESLLNKIVKYVHPSKPTIERPLKEVYLTTLL